MARHRVPLGVLIHRGRNRPLTALPPAPAPCNEATRAASERKRRRG